MNVRLSIILILGLGASLSGCARASRVKQAEAELFVAQGQIKTLQDRLNSLENASVGSTNNLAERVETTEKSQQTLKSRVDKIDADTSRFTAAISQDMEGVKKNVGDVLAAKKQMEESLPQLTTFADANKKMQEDVAKLQREYGQRLRDLETKSDSLRADVTALNGANDHKTEDSDKKLADLRSDLVRRIETTNSDILALRNATKDNVDDIKKALETMGQSIYEILRLQRSQFTNLRDEYDSSMSKIEPYLPKNTLGDTDPGKTGKKETAPEKETPKSGK